MRFYRLIYLVCLLAGPAVAEVTLPQSDGSKLTLPGTVTEVITLSPHLAELVFAAGAESQLVATVEYSNYPEAAASIPRIGDAFRIDIERIMSLKPGLVIAWGSGNPRPAIEQLESLGVPVWSVEIRSPEQIADVLVEIGNATGHITTAQAAADRFSDRLRALSERYSARIPVDYFYQIADRPLFTINNEHLIAQGLMLCGGHNIFADQPGLAFQVSHESVIVANPDALFAPDTETTTNPLETWHDWPGMRAVQQDALFLLPADKISRATPRWLDAVEIACRLMDNLPQRRNHE